MDVAECVVSAGRAVLDLVEREWQPLSPGELELRLDQAVEELLEADLLSRAGPRSSLAPPVSVCPRLRPEQANARPQLTHASATAVPVEEEAADARGCSDPTVKKIRDVLQSSKSRARMSGRARLSLTQTVLLSLTLLSERVSYRSVSRRFRLEKGNIHRIFFSFCECISGLAGRHISWPVGSEITEALRPLGSVPGKETGPGIPRVLGVLGCTWIPIRLPAGKHDTESSAPEVKRARRAASPDSWIHLELVCDHQGRFLHCGVSRGSDADMGRALSHKLKSHPELMPPGCCLVARAGYPLTAHILTPYADSHEPREQLFNRTLEGHFQVLNRALAGLRARFQRLRYLDIGSYQRARAVVLTACVLHNVLLDGGGVVQAEVEHDEDVGQTGEGECDEEGTCRRDAVSHVLYKIASLKTPDVL